MNGFFFFNIREYWRVCNDVEDRLIVNRIEIGMETVYSLENFLVIFFLNCCYFLIRFLVRFFK